mgnify:CR=1 FL=1
MTQNEKRLFLIKYLLNENSKYSDIIIPEDIEEQKRLLRSLLNVRMPKKVSSEFLEIQDSYLQEEISKKGITDIGELEPIKKGIYVWQGDITTLKCDAIVNAANNRLLGCLLLGQFNMSTKTTVIKIIDIIPCEFQQIRHPKSSI